MNIKETLSMELVKSSLDLEYAPAAAAGERRFCGELNLLGLALSRCGSSAADALDDGRSGLSLPLVADDDGMRLWPWIFDLI